jgi:hypothetical protein
MAALHLRAALCTGYEELYSDRLLIASSSFWISCKGQVPSYGFCSNFLMLVDISNVLEDEM